jgi:hypothetical protein
MSPHALIAAALVVVPPVAFLAVLWLTDGCPPLRWRRLRGTRAGDDDDAAGPVMRRSASAV